jgi:hypothetical protein
VGPIDPQGLPVCPSVWSWGEAAGVPSVFSSGFLKMISEMNFQKLLKCFRKSYLEIYDSKIYETNFVVNLMTRSIV